MKIIKNSKVKNKLLILTGFMLTGILLIGIMGISFMNKLDSNSKEIVSVWIKGITLADTLNKNLSEFRLQEYKYIDTANMETRKEAEVKFEKISNIIEQYFDEYKPLCVSYEDMQLLNSAFSAWTNYLNSHKEMIDLISLSSEINKTSYTAAQLKAVNIMEGNLQKIYTETGSHFTALADFNFNKTAEIITTANSQLQLIKLILIVLIILILVFSIFLSLKILNSIV